MPRPSLIWLITDTHFFHDAMIKLCGRPVGFEKLIMKNLKYVVAEQDVLIHLGDVIFYKYPQIKEMMDSVPCRKILTMGNHDRRSKGWYMRNGFDFVVDTYSSGNVVFSHKPIEVLPSGATYNIHGHFHLATHRTGDDTWYNPEVHKCLSLERQDYKPIQVREFLPEAKL